MFFTKMNYTTEKPFDGFNILITTIDVVIFIIISISVMVGLFGIIEICSKKTCHKSSFANRETCCVPYYSIQT